MEEIEIMKETRANGDSRRVLWLRYIDDQRNVLEKALVKKEEKSQHWQPNDFHTLGVSAPVTNNTHTFINQFSYHNT